MDNAAAAGHPPMSARSVVLGASALSALLVLGLLVGTQLGSNLMLLAMDRSNAIPQGSSIFTFEPTVINAGSSSYWLYGKDRSRYYHFTHNARGEQISMPIENHCPGFDPHRLATWCTAQRRSYAAGTR